MKFRYELQMNAQTYTHTHTHTHTSFIENSIEAGILLCGNGVFHATLVARTHARTQVVQVTLFFHLLRSVTSHAFDYFSTLSLTLLWLSAAFLSVLSLIFCLFSSQGDSGRVWVLLSFAFFVKVQVAVSKSRHICLSIRHMLLLFCGSLIQIDDDRCASPLFHFGDYMLPTLTKSPQIEDTQKM